MCAGLVAPFAGELCVAGADPASGAVRGRVRFVPAEPPLFPELTVSQHVALFGHIRPESAHRLESRIEQYRLTPFVDVVVAELSTGNRQKANIIFNTMNSGGGGDFGVGFLGDSGGAAGVVYLLDEPFNGLDAGSAEVLSGEMRAWAHEGATVVYTHHEQGPPADGVLSLGAKVFDLAAATSGNGVTSPALPAEG